MEEKTKIDVIGRRLFPLIVLIALLLLVFLFQQRVDEGSATVEIGGVDVELVIADEPWEWTQGLMGVTKLKKNEGMIFDFGADKPLVFWMKDTPVVLDMVFLNSDKYVIDIIENAQPCLEYEDANKDCMKYRPFEEGQYVIELKGGFAEEFGLKKGDLIEFELYVETAEEPVAVPVE